MSCRLLSPAGLKGEWGEATLQVPRVRRHQGKRAQRLLVKQDSHHKRPPPTRLLDSPNEVGKQRPRDRPATPAPVPCFELALCATPWGEHSVPPGGPRSASAPRRDPYGMDGKVKSGSLAGVRVSRRQSPGALRRPAPSPEETLPFGSQPSARKGTISVRRYGNQAVHGPGAVH